MPLTPPLPLSLLCASCSLTRSGWEDLAERLLDSGAIRIARSASISTRAPLAFTPEAFADPHDRTTGYRSISVPAILAGLDLVLKNHGGIDWKHAIAAAIRCAEQGFIVDTILGDCLQNWSKQTNSESRAALFPDGNIPRTGEPWVQKQILPVLRQIAEGGSDVFYKGNIAQTIARHVQLHGGLLAVRDFSEYRAQTVEPLTVDYRGYDVYTPPPPAGGLTTLQILQTLKHFQLADMKPWGAPYFDLLAQATRLCWQERAMALGDPNFIEIPLNQLLSEQRAMDRALRIQRRDAGTPLPAPPDRPCTANVSIIDSQRNAVSITATQGVYFGSQMVIPGLGLVMNHGMSRFDYPPPANHPNLPLPGKRMQHNMAPTMVLKDSQPRFVVGLPGGTRIISVTAQLAIDLIDFGASAQQTVRAPRINAQNDQPIIVSSAVSDGVMDELRALGNDVVRGQIEGPPMEVGGMANALAFDPKTGKLEAASQGSEEFAIVM